VIGEITEKRGGTTTAEESSTTQRSSDFAVERQRSWSEKDCKIATRWVAQPVG